MSSPSILACLACAAPIVPVHPMVNYVHCGTCFRVFRHEDGQLQDGSPCTIIFQHTERMQVGVKGKWQNQHFTVIGRCRLYLNESVFNYWTIVFEDQSLAWLAEGYGLYFIVPDVTRATILRPGLYDELQHAETGDKITFPGEKDQAYILEQIQYCHKTEMDGQAFFPDIDYAYTVFEAANTKGQSKTAFAYKKDQRVFLYDLLPARPEELALSGLREAVASKKEFVCGVCDANIQVKNYPYAQSCICDSCGTGYYLEGTDYKNSHQKFPQNRILDLPISIGATGNFNGTMYIVHGYAEKQEKNIYKARWREYYLLQPNCRYAVLSEFDGHWIFVQEASDAPVLTNPDIAAFDYKDKTLTKYNRYQYTLINASGAFPHNILDNQETMCYEYVHPPQVWIYEKDRNDGIRWFIGEHIEASSVKKAFGLTKQLPYKKGLGAVTPLPTDHISGQSLFTCTIAGFLFLLLLHLGIGAGKTNQVLVPFQTIPMADTSDVVSVTFDNLVLNKSSSNVNVFVAANVQNSWFELSGSLINKNNGNEYSFSQGVEYYAGVEDGESWSEGSKSENFHVASIPSGNYILQLQGTREHSTWNNNNTNEFQVEVKYDVGEASNIFWALGFMLIWPIGMALLIRYNNERRRNNSAF